MRNGEDVEITVNEDKSEIYEQQQELVKLEEPLIYDSGEFDYDKLKDGMQKDMESMKKFEVYEEVNVEQLSPDQQASILPSRWVHREKGNEVRARLVVKGCFEPVYDKDDTYASTPFYRASSSSSLSA